MFASQEEKQSLKQQYIRERGYFSDWNDTLLENDPQFLRDVMCFARSCEGEGYISEKIRHLIWLALDTALTHIFPFGIELHARAAQSSGATNAEILETLRIASAFNSSVDRAAAIISKAAAGLKGGSVNPALSPLWAPMRTRYTEALQTLGGGAIEEPALDTKVKELLSLAMAASPAMFDPEATFLHARRALDAGATHEELAETITIASGIGIHGLIAALPLIKPLLTNKSSHPSCGELEPKL